MPLAYQGPAQYVQEPGAIGDSATALSNVSGETALVIGGATALSLTREALTESMTSAGIEVAEVINGVDRCSPERIASCAAKGQQQGVDMVVGVGGGHALDTAKGTAIELDASVITVPTVASTDAPCSAIAALYREDDGAYEKVIHRDRNPELVIVDTDLIANAPVSFLRDGMADAFATKFEAEAVAANKDADTVAGGRPTDTGLVLAQRCYDNLEAYGTRAIAAAERDAVTPALEVIVETNTLLSGVGFECGGLAAAHALQEGFTRAGVDASHGTVVGFSTITQLVLEDRDRSTMDDALALYLELGLDVTLDELGVDEETLDSIAEHACADDTPMNNEPVPVSPERVVDAMQTADHLIQRGR